MVKNISNIHWKYVDGKDASQKKKQKTILQKSLWID